MQTAPANLLTRDDTLFGICQGLGEDLGISPDYIRVTLAVLLLWNPPAVVAAYAAIGVIVLTTRLLIPARRKGATAQPVAAAPTVSAAPVEEFEEERLPLAA
jgi:phage shock protein C